MSVARPECPLCWVEAHAGNPGKRLSTPLQLEHLQRTFLELNPGSDVDFIDWGGVLDEKGTMGENVDAFEAEYPQFRWEAPEAVGPGAYEEMVIEGLGEEAEPYGYELIRARKREGLERASRRADRLKVSLEECQAAGPRRRLGPGVCRMKTVDVVAHKRCQPRMTHAGDA
ncbi:hypothetical protein HQ586_00640 [Candidatus Bathyarchaeota archaeon]|nr:hypothetical protein [Candidatus Bathyarchaeota archaeon]